eukprot:Nk52_evm36s250 gene=Nk52_evmTU36s250
MSSDGGNALIKDPNCVFCKIIDKEVKTEEILFQNDKYIAFRDIKPAASTHFLVVPVNHVRDGKSLTANDSAMLDEMEKIGLDILKGEINKKGGDDSNNNNNNNNRSEQPITAGGIRFGEDYLTGYHWPPFNSISHLHLHVIYPVKEMGFIARTVFRKNTWWFKTTEWIKDTIKNL